jgi:ribosomal-protein-serine acetyltransferase
LTSDKESARSVCKSDNGVVEPLPETMPAPRLGLRRWTTSDAPQLSAAIEANLEHLRPWMPWVKAEPLNANDRVALIDQWQVDWERGGDVVIGVFLDGEVVGSSGLHRRRGPATLEIGYWVHRTHTRQGIATEVAKSLTSAAFTVTGIDQVEIHHDKANIASEGVPRRLGFTFMGEARDSVTSPGELGIDCRWMIDRGEWMERVNGER